MIMRPIKFRAWDSHNKEMWHGDLFSPIWTDGTVQDCYSEYMQYTGLKDKNGKEIYEGDLYKSDHSASIYQVHILHGCTLAAPTNITPTGEPLSYNFDTGEWDDDLSWLEVIGNIYEDKHILEEDQ